jgi:lysophospholipase L1-like esterase
LSTVREIPDIEASRAARTPEAIYFLGDSITLGWRDEDLGGWPARLMRRLARQGYSITGYNLGVRGDTSGQIAERWEQEVGRRQRGLNSLLVFAFGVNDAKVAPDGTRPTALSETVSSIRRILDGARDYRVLLIGPAPVDEPLMQRRLNTQGMAAMPTAESIVAITRRMESEARSAGVPFLDLLDGLSSNAVWRKSLADTDGLHPSRDGHDLIADLIQGWPAWAELFPRLR